ncbi:Uncharacterised protein [Mycobacteroides abscessus subsp. bolletii]|nr:Uncharacterised protein [Mycobacteroides abscessus]SKE74523.1 Uncharacterised protein [Mycobacteroides abscessus subsp. bolletii]SKG02570.1 Uncharacterised protein [Mycobacteroides abscessus subsp. bolletii]
MSHGTELRDFFLALDRVFRRGFSCIQRKVSSLSIRKIDLLPYCNEDAEGGAADCGEPAVARVEDPNGEGVDWYFCEDHFKEFLLKECRDHVRRGEKVPLCLQVQ